MYIASLNVENRKMGVRALCRVMMNIFLKENRKKISARPYYIGNLLWNDLPVNIQFAETVGQFKERVSNRYKVYGNIDLIDLI